MPSRDEESMVAGCMQEWFRSVEKFRTACQLPARLRRLLSLLLGRLDVSLASSPAHCVTCKQSTARLWEIRLSDTSSERLQIWAAAALVSLPATFWCLRDATCVSFLTAFVFKVLWVESKAPYMPGPCPSLSPPSSGVSVHVCI